MKITLRNITATSEVFFEHESRKVLVFIPKEEIRQIGFGYVAPIRWPVCALLTGIALVVVGVVFGVMPLVETIIAHSNNAAKLKGTGGVSLLMIFGIYFRQGFRKANCLILNTGSGIRKLVIDGPVESQNVSAFLDVSRRLLGIVL